ncbi:MAG: urea transporter [Mariprofundaceae bacterium]|nr:urea transporter [Mariprofundaceae bacterium]
MIKHNIFTDMLAGLLRSYASILFAERPWIGAAFLLATFWFPNAGMSGLIAALVGMATAKVLRFNHLESGLHVYNSLLVGLSLGAYYQLDIYLAVLIVLGAIMAVFATVALVDMLWRLDHLPVLSLPFVLVALTTSLAAHSYGTLSRYLVPMMPHNIVFTPWVDQFLTALGSSFFTPHPIPGLLMFIGLLITSRYLALLAVMGFALGFSTYTLLSGSPYSDLMNWNGFNFILTAIALGGIFTVPDKQSFVLAMVGSVLAALITAATETLMLVYGLPVMTVPFLVTTLIVLLALKKRPTSPQLQLLLDAPALPEKSYERSRLAQVRHGEYGSTPLSLPFYGRWTVYQGFDGTHTHRPPWQYALDFYITEQGKSFANDGLQLNDYYCFGLPLLAPATGYVIAAENRLPDNAPGHVDTHHNWGNYIIIRMANGLHVLLAHLQQGSVLVLNGSYVHVGDTLAKCGSSGRSPQPHVHLHVQAQPTLGSMTYPFHLHAVLLRKQASTDDSFQLHARPKEGMMVMLPKTDAALRSSLDLRVGRNFVFDVVCGNKQYSATLTVVLTLDGEFRLRSNSGASAAFMDQPDLLVFYDRQGPEDKLLDAIVLAMGLMPLNEGVMHWSDQPPMALMPMDFIQSLLAHSYYPLGEGLSSHYSRQWQDDSWVQEGEHHLAMLFGDGWHARSVITLMPSIGFTVVHLQCSDYTLTAQLQRYGQQGDGGIPSWEVMMNDKKTGE